MSENENGVGNANASVQNLTLDETSVNIYTYFSGKTTLEEIIAARVLQEMGLISSPKTLETT